jgi:Pyridoxamine 5'-phosphate oxidase
MSREGKGAEAGRSRPLPWSEAERRLAGGGWFWLATVRPDGAPHVMPLFAAWANTSFFIASKDRARKSRNLEAEPRCVITTDTDDLHIIVEGIASHRDPHKGARRCLVRSGVLWRDRLGRQSPGGRRRDRHPSAAVACPVQAIELSPEEAGAELRRALALFRPSRLFRALVGPHARPPVGILRVFRIRIDDTP